MVRSTLVQSRINAFEAAAAVAATRAVPKSGPKYQVNQVNLLETPIPPSASPLAVISPNKPPSSSKSSSPSPPHLGLKTSLIDLKDWVLDDGLPPPQLTNGNSLPTSSRPSKDQKPGAVNPTPLISIEIPPASMHGSPPPPLPPREPSYGSLRSISSMSTRSGQNSSPPHVTQSLSVEHTYPPLSKLSVVGINRNGKGHVPTSSVSSFHSVSLSSDGGLSEGFQSPKPARRTLSQDNRDDDSFSLDESFEQVSASSAMSSSSFTIVPEKFVPKDKKPPQLPQRPTASASVSPPLPSRSTSSSSTSRRPPPPQAPPRTTPSLPHSPRASLSDRSSLRSTISKASNATAPTMSKPILSRPTPIPASARARYEALFVANVLQRRKLEKMREIEKEQAKAGLSRKARQAAGWRGLSVDLITNAATPPVVKTLDVQEMKVDETISYDEKLEGTVVKLVWEMSCLDRQKLRAIWDDCDGMRCGALDRNSFVKGMWRIDEELRRMRTVPQTTSLWPRPPEKPSGTKLVLR